MTEKKRSSRGGSPEMRAVQKIYHAIKPLTVKQRQNSVKATLMLLGDPEPFFSNPDLIRDIKGESFPTVPKTSDVEGEC